MGQCDGCGQSIKAGHPQGNGVVYCVDCHYKASQVRLQTMNHSAAMMNYLGGQIDEIFGLPPRQRINVPQPTYISGDVNNSINIADSVVGAVNTGTIENLNTSLNNVAVNNPEVAQKLVAISRVIASDKTIPEHKKEECLEALTFLSEQAQRPVDQRNRSMIKSAGKHIRSTLGLSADLVALAPVVTELIKAIL
jgi:hypothetical protein